MGYNPKSYLIHIMETEILLSESHILTFPVSESINDTLRVMPLLDILLPSGVCQERFVRILCPLSEGNSLHSNLYQQSPSSVVITNVFS